jgi:hypothetical protein
MIADSPPVDGFNGSLGVVRVKLAPLTGGRKAAGAGLAVRLTAADQGRQTEPCAMARSGPAGEPKAAELIRQGSCSKTPADWPPARRGAGCLTLLAQCSSRSLGMGPPWLLSAKAAATADMV